MGTKRGGEGRRLKAIRRGLSMESLERRDLLASGSDVFTGPSLTSLIAQAEHGKNTSQAQINAMVGALQSQLTAGPLADLDSGAVTADGFITGSQALEAGYEQYAAQQLGAKFPSLDQVIAFQGQRVIDNLVAGNQETSVGLISSAAFASDAKTTIDSLTAGPIVAIGTKSSTLIALTKTTDSSLTTVANLYAGGSLTLQQAATTIEVEAEAYRSDVHAALQVTQLKISGETDAKINALERTVVNLATTSPSTASSQLSTAVTTFGNQVDGKTGLIGTNGALVHSKGSKLNPSRSNGQAASVFSGVSGSSTFGGSSTLTATLTSSNGSPLMGEPVAFTIDGAFAGLGITNFHGVATVANAPSTAAVGTDTGGIIATFRSDTNFLATGSTGNLAVAGQGSVVGQVSGTAVFGGTAKLTASLTNASGQALAGRTLTFTLDGASVGSAVTDATGVASLSGVATTDAVGTVAGGVVASFAGGSSYASSANLGNLVVSPAPTTLSGVSGSAQFGGTASLTATLTSSTTNKGISGERVSFTLHGASVGTATTDSNGVATLTGVAIAQQFGLGTTPIAATFAGDPNYAAATAATGNLVVSPASTALSSVGGTATFGGTATLTATLTSLATKAAFAGQTVQFSLGGKSVGSAVTNGSGVATLTGVATTAAVGTETNAVVASYAGTTNDASTTSTGNLVVSQQSTALTNVSGAAAFGGPATLSATLATSVGGTPLANKTVTFTLNGTAAGNAVTDASGVATLIGVSQSFAVGMLSSAVVATFAGDASDASSGSASGNFTVTPAVSTLSGVSGAAQFGGKATFNATLKSNASGKGIPGENVTFTLNGTSVGSVLTDANGVATLTNVLASAAVGTQRGVVSANFAGDTNYDAAPGSLGDFVVSKATTSFTSVSGSSAVGGPATLMATLISAATNAGIVGETVTFSLDDVIKGTAVTGAGGVATFTVPTITDAAGTHNGSVGVSYAGTADYVATQDSGNLVVA